MLFSPFSESLLGAAVGIENQTGVAEFILVGFPNIWGMRVLFIAIPAHLLGYGEWKPAFYGPDAE